MKFVFPILLAGAVLTSTAVDPARAGCVTGAVAGCVAGHEIAKHRKEERLHAEQLNQQQLDKMHAENGAGH